MGCGHKEAHHSRIERLDLHPGTYDKEGVTMSCKHEFIFWTLTVEKCIHCAETRQRDDYGVVKASPSIRRKARPTCKMCGRKVRGLNHALHCKRKVD